MIAVTVYTQPACGSCIATKRHLAKRGIDFLEQPMNDDIRVHAQGLNIMSAPVIVVAGDVTDIWGGYRPDRIDELVA